MRELKTILFMILALLAVTSCAPKKVNKSKVTFSKLYIGGPGAFTGGAMVWGDGPSGKFAINLKGDASEKTLEEGIYTFYSVGWLGTNDTEGIFKCGMVTKEIKNPEETVAISLTEANCLTDDFVDPAYIGVVPNGLRLHSCADITSVSGAGNCPAAQGTSVQSWKYIYPEYDGSPSALGSTGLSSACLPGASGMNNTSNRFIMGKVGLDIFSTRVETYTSGDCSGTPNSYPFHGGLINSSSGSSPTKVYVGSSRIELFTEDGWNTNFVSYYELAYSAGHSADAAFGMTIVAKNGLGTTVTTSDTSLNSETFLWTGFANSINGVAPTLPSSLVFTSGVATAVITATKAETIPSGAITLTDSSSITGAGSSILNIVHGPKAGIVFGTQPSAVAAGDFITSFDVKVVDVYENVITNNTDTVNLSLATGSGTILTGLSATAVAGVATYTLTSLDVSGPYSFTATNGGLSVTSNIFNVTHGAASQLVFTTQPAGSPAGTDLLPALELRDGFGNVVDSGVDSTQNVTFSVVSGPGPLRGTVSKALVAGTVTWTGAEIMDIIVKGTYTLQASDGTRNINSNSFVITHSAPGQVRFQTQPVSHEALTAAPDIVAELVDAWGNIVDSSSDPFTLSWSINPSGSQISGSTTALVNAVSGVATFSGLIFNGANGGNHNLSVNALSFNRTSNAFLLTAPTPPGQVLSLTDEVEAITNDLHLAWNPPSPLGNTAGYRISYQTGPTAPLNCTSGIAINEASIVGTKHVLPTLNPGTQYTFKVCAIDSLFTPQESSGVTKTITMPYQVFRSVGPLNFTALFEDLTQTVTFSLSGGVATFSTTVPPSVGLGDILQYDSTGGIATPNATVMVTKRLSATQLAVKNIHGTGNPGDVATVQRWNIYRAYTSLFDAERGVESTAIETAISNFDTFTGGKDITASNQIYNLVLYKDGVDTTGAIIDGWTTGPNNYLNIFTPTLSDHVGATQRHLGAAFSGFKISTTGNSPIIISDPHVRVTGLELVHNNPTNNSATIRFGSTGATVADIRISHNLITHATGASTAYGIQVLGALAAQTKVSIYNNVIYNPLTHGIFTGSGNILIYNNTIDVGTGTGSCVYRNGATVTVKNNLCDGGAPDFGGILPFDPASDYNVSSDTSAPGANSIFNQVPTFLNPGSGDYRLHFNDTAATDVGVDLSADPILKIMDDVTGVARTGTWDVGADSN